jgi:hypothetical protein
MEEQDRSAIAARHPHHELAQDQHATAPVIATHRSTSPKVDTEMRLNWLRFENYRGLPDFELAVQDKLDPLIADGMTQTGDPTMLGRSVVLRR